MGFARWGEVDDARVGLSQWRKTLASTATASTWYDDSMLSGIPPANFYASSPLEAATLDYRDGIRHWPPDGASTEHLLDATVLAVLSGTEAPSNYLICDYVLYYPFLDGDSTDAQLLTNTVGLPRFADGAGLRMFLVAQGVGAAPGAYTVSYTNHAGVSGRSASGTTPTPSATALLLTGGAVGAADRYAPFIALQAGDRGVRSVESFTWTTPPGGIAALVIVKPLAQFVHLERENASETVFHPRLPEVSGDAFLGLLRHTGNTSPAAGLVLHGMLQTVKG